MTQYLDNELTKLAEMAMEKPEDFGWWGDEEMFVTWGWAGVDVHRDSNILDQSNFEVITKDLMEKYPDDFKIVGLGHWAVGHVDRLTVRILKDANAGFVEENITNAFEEAMVWVDWIRDNVIADETHYYELESEHKIRYINEFIDPMVAHGVNDAEEILSWMEEHDVYFSPDADQYPNPNDMILAAYHLKMIDPEYQDEWDEWCDMMELRRPEWEVENFGKPMDGQLSLFDD